MSDVAMTVEQALAGIRIADFTWYGAGPLATRFFAHYGAQVIKLESRAKLDAVRFVGPFVGGTPGFSLPASETITDPNLSSAFSHMNSNKLSVQLNLGLPEGRDIARRLVKISDIVIDNFAPRIMEDWELTYEDLVRVKPDIIVARMPMIGAEGPQREYVGLGSSLSAMAGIDELTGMPMDPPLGTGTNYPDASSNPCHTAIALLAALRHRRKTGKGQLIEVSQFESTVQLIGTALLNYSINRRNEGRRGNTHPEACPHGAYRCKGDDRWCVIAIFTDAEWANLCRAMGRDQLITDPRFATLKDRLVHTDEVDRIVEAWTALCTAEEVMETLQVASVAAGIVQTAEDVLDKDPQLAARNHWVYLDHPGGGRLAHGGETFKLSRTPGRIHTVGPSLGQHTDYVCRDLLGMTEPEIEALKEQKVLY